jgi:uncharacterized protein YhbP (UPF0306 family)
MVRKRLFPVKFDDTEAARMATTNSEVYIDGKENCIGTLRGVQGQHGIAHLRVKDALASCKADTKLNTVADGITAHFVPVIPSWWPPEVTHSDL